MNFLLLGVPLQGGNHGCELIFEMQVDKLLFVFIFHFWQSDIVCKGLERPFDAQLFPRFGCSGDILNYCLQFSHDNLVLRHHIDRL